MKQRRVLLGLAALTALAMVEKAVGLSAPWPAEEAPRTLRVAGYRVEALPSSPPRRGRELSHGTVRRFRLAPVNGGPALTLTLVPARSRTATDLSEETLGGKGLSLEAVRVAVPELALREPRLSGLRVATGAGAAPAMDQIALGRGPADPAGRASRLQTCLTASGTAAVKATSLAGKGEPPRRAGEPEAQRDRLLRLAGLSHSRHACLAVQVALAGQAGTTTDLETAWRAVRASLQP